MFRSIPTNNKILEKKWVEKHQTLHHRTLREVRPSVNSSCPPSFVHLKRKAKRDQLLEERFTEIERENRLLLEKMTGLVTYQYGSHEPFMKKSLNKDARKREISSITQENKALLRRIKNKTASYSISQWEADRKKQEKRLNAICQYPYQLGVTGKPHKKQKLKPISKVVLKKGINIGDKYFLIEVHRIPKKIVIFAYNTAEPDTFRLKLPASEAKLLMGGSDDFDKLVSLLTLENGELVLLSSDLSAN